MATSHSAVGYKNNNHMDSMNGKATHTHIPRMYNGIDTTFNSTMIIGGGMQECGVCGEVMTDCHT